MSVGEHLMDILVSSSNESIRNAPCQGERGAPIVSGNSLSCSPREEDSKEQEVQPAGCRYPFPDLQNSAFQSHTVETIIELGRIVSVSVRNPDNFWLNGNLQEKEEMVV